MSDHNLAEALRRMVAAVEAHEASEFNSDHPALHASAKQAREALAAHEKQQAAQQQAGEAVAWVDERSIAWLDGRSRTATITTRLQAGKSLERPMPLFAHPQQPLTREQIRLERKRIDPMAEDMDAWSFKQGVRFAERAHGITKDTK